nr:MAG TPA_asm: amylase [Caudoviricetes sp.]
MWICGDWGQASPWSRDTGVKMVKGDDDVYTGELSLPKGTQFDIKILKSTVSTTSGDDNKWSAVRYRSTLNMSSSHDFGEFTDNLIPNGSFDEGPVRWDAK